MEKTGVIESITSTFSRSATDKKAQSANKVTPMALPRVEEPLETERKSLKNDKRNFENFSKVINYEVKSGGSNLSLG